MLLSADDVQAVGGLQRSAPRKEVKGGAPAAHPPVLSDQPGPLHPRQEAWHICTPPCTPPPRHLAFRYGAMGAQASHEMRPPAPGRLVMGQPGHPDPGGQKLGPRLRAGGSAPLPAPAPQLPHPANKPGSSTSYQQPQLAGSF